MPHVSKLVSFWSFLLFAGLLALQAFPYTGIFLMMLGAASLSGVLIHVFLISLFIEAGLRRVPRFLIVIPIAAYGGYYVFYAQQMLEIAQKSAELRASNPGKVLDFDARAHSLVTTDANRLTQYYAIPVAYEANANFQPEGHLSYRLIRRDQCNIRKDSQHRIQTFGMHLGHSFQQGVCVLRFPEAPTAKAVTAVRSGDDEIWRRKWGISEQVTELRLDGAVIGRYRSASVWRLPALPMGVVGCALISSTPAWKCGADFLRTHTVIEAVPFGVDRVHYDTPLSVMLALKKYTEADLANFRGYALNGPALARIAGESDRVEDDVFKVLADILDGRDPKPPFNLGFSLSRNPERLAPFAERMAGRFVELNGLDPRNVPNHQEITRALATALVSLPQPAFARVAERVFTVIDRDQAWDKYPALYVRAGDAGPKTLARYKQDFMSGKLKRFLLMLPVLAICRVGQADDDTIAEMKARFIAPGASYSDDEYKTALFVTLLKLGQESFLRDNMQSLSNRTRGWADAVLDRKGETEKGPNNCMAERWNNTDYHGPIMEPGLQWMRGAWNARVQTN
jgi:hypothetical protein